MKRAFDKCRGLAVVPKLVCWAALAYLASVGNAVMGAGYLIDPTTLNGSFEMLGGLTPATLKATHWDTDPDGDVDNWILWDTAVGGPAVASDNSGTEVNLGTASHGDRIGFLQADNAVYNLTSYVVQAGDYFDYSWDWVLAGRGPAIVQLAYQDVGGSIIAIPDTESTNPNNATQHFGLGAGTFTVTAGNPAVGRPIALTIRAPAGSNFPEVDNFILTVNVGPGDVDADGFTNLVDYRIIRDNFFLATGATRPLGDLTRDGRVDLFDYGVWKNHAPPAVLASLGIPEPSSVALAVIGLTAVAHRRRWRV